MCDVWGWEGTHATECVQVSGQICNVEILSHLYVDLRVGIQAIRLAQQVDLGAISIALIKFLNKFLVWG